MSWYMLQNETNMIVTSNNDWYSDISQTMNCSLQYVETSSSVLPDQAAFQQTDHAAYEFRNELRTLMVLLIIGRGLDQANGHIHVTKLQKRGMSYVHCIIALTFPTNKPHFHCILYTISSYNLCRNTESWKPASMKVSPRTPYATSLRPFQFLLDVYSWSHLTEEFLKAIWEQIVHF